MDWTHTYIAGTAVLVFALVGLVLLIGSQQVKIANTRAGPYLKFIWANFIKPHDKQAGGQQDALESFYKTQVRGANTKGGDGADQDRLRFTMRPVVDCSVVERICWDSWARS